MIKAWGGEIVYICTGLVSACSIDFCHCDMSLWSVSNRKGILTIGQQFPALLREEVFLEPSQNIAPAEENCCLPLLTTFRLFLILHGNS